MIGQRGAMPRSSLAPAGRARARCITVATAAATALAFASFGATSALAAITPATNDAAGAADIAATIAAPPTNVTGASYDSVPPTGTPNGTADSSLSSFPTHGATFGILTTGNVAFADDTNDNDDTSADLDGPNVRGDTDFDVTVLKVDLDVPASANCLTFDLQYYSEEFPEFVNTAFNDAFIAELDRSTWTTSESAISAPDNFAFDPSGDVISVNSSGNTSMNTANAAGTTYDGATPLLSASKQVSPGAHSLYLSTFDQGDQNLDSAVFLDSLTVGFVPDPEVNCQPGAQPKLFGLTLSPASAENPTGTAHTVTATLTDENGSPLANEAVDFDVTGANSASGSGSTNASGEATFTYTGTNAGTDVISACYDADDDGICEATASATNIATPPPPDGTPPPSDGTPPPSDGTPPPSDGTPPPSDGTPPPPDGTLPPPVGTPLPPVGPPVVGESVNVSVLSGVIGVKCEGDSEFRPLEGAEQIPVGCLIDARNGHVLLTSSRGTAGGTQTAEFWGGIFRVEQKVGSKPFTVLVLAGPNASPSAAAARRGGATVAGRRKRRLWGKGSGRFRSRGRHGAGSARGTTWLVADIGDTTLCKVKKGKVRFRDFILDKTVTLRAGETYVAKRRKR
jgi:hypothetical protein